MSNTKGLPLIGKGSFTKCFRKDSKTVLLVSSCPIKECMALGWFPQSTLFPKLEVFDNSYNMFTMKYYKKHSSLKKSLKPLHWDYYQELRNIFKNLVGAYPKNKYDYADFLRENFKKIKTRRLRVALLEAVDACQNYGSDVCFEVSPRNVACNNGSLVLLDCFFIESHLRRVKSK